jgi:diguanylate cyclase (GGDEF)-like protein/PAS domain S-box-containing protein
VVASISWLSRLPIRSNYAIRPSLTDSGATSSCAAAQRGGTQECRTVLVLFLLLAGGIAAAAICIVLIRRRQVRDAADRDQSARREHNRNHVLELLAHGAPLPAVLEAIVRGVEQEHPDMLCSIMLIGNEGSRLYTGAAPSLPASYSDAIDGIEIGIGAGSCGTAAFTGQRVIVEDVLTHPYWAPYRELADAAGLGSCWSEPISSVSGRVFGTFAIYHRQPHRPTDEEIRLIEQTANLAEVALGRSYADQALKDSEKLLSDILENVTAYIYTKDTHGRYLFANRLLRERFDAPLEEIIGYDDYKFFDADTADSMRKDDLRVLQNGETIQVEETSLNILTGVTEVFLSVKLPLRREDGSIHALCGISTDITERKDIEEHMKHMAQYDALTHLPNRALFEDRLHQAIAAAQRNRAHLALMFIDLDKFKPVNDTYGHGIGDLLLKEVATRIQDCLRDSDTAARIGGDEFVILLPAIESAADASKVGEKIRISLNQPFALAGHTLGIGSSIGVAVYPQHGSNEKLLVKSADIAMYHAKKNGRNNVKIYQPGMQEVSQ